MGMINDEELDVARKARKIGEYVQTAQVAQTANAYNHHESLGWLHCY